MATGIGERLREARSARGLDLEEIAARTKIRAGYLRAMEEERWELLPAPAYVRGFLRTYAELLGLDADAVVDEFLLGQESREAEARPEAVPPGTISGRLDLGLLRRAAVALRRAPSREGEPGRGRRPGRGAIAVIAGAALLGVVLVLFLLGAPEDETREPAERAAPEDSRDSAGSEREAAPAETPSRVTLRLTTTGTVWVCLVDQEGLPRIEGVTLPAGEEQEFRGRSFEVGLGNGQVELRANGELVEIPAVAEPIGYRITPERTRELDAEERPTCV